MLRTAKKALSFVLVIALLLPMACISNISVSAEANTYKLGDVDRNGRINVRDAALIQRYVAKLAELDADQLYLANVDGRTGVTVRDAAIIQRNVAHMDIPETAKNKDGKKIGDVVTIENGKLVDDIEPTTEASTTVPAELTDGYYLIGPDWTVDSINVSDKFAANSGKEDEYMLKTTLTKGDKIKVVEVKEKKIEAWYPSGMDNEYNVDEAHSGNVTIYFKTTEQTDWSDFGGFFYIEATKPSETTKPIEETTKAQEETTVPSDKNTVKFSNNKGWSKVYLYAWDGEGEAKVENAAWPGVELTEKSTNGYGEDQYTATFDKKFTKIIFNDGKEQTVDIDYDATVTGYYPTEKNDKGFWKVDSWTDKPVEETTKAQEETTKAQEETTKAQEETTVPSDKNTVKFSNNKGWSKVYLYAWDGEGEAKVENAAWPGVELTEKSTNGYGEEQYTATFDKKFTKIIFNNGDKEQTVDIDYDATVTGYYPTEKNDKGFWKVDSWTDKPVEETTKAQEETTKAQEETTKAQEETTVPSDKNTVKFSNNKGWSKVYLYAWDGEGEAKVENAAWPGVELTEKSTNGYGEEQYTATFDKKFTKIIFNDGKEQTVDIDYDATVTGYYPTEKNDKGEWKVDSWTDKPVEETTKAQEETTKAQEETTKPSDSYTYYFLPSDADVAAGYTFKLNINDEAGTAPEYWHQYDMIKTEDTVGGKPVYKCTFTASYKKANEIQFQSWNKGEWNHQTHVNKGTKTELAELDGKLVKASDNENVNGEIVEYKPDDTSETTVPETTVSETTVPETTVSETTVPETTAPDKIYTAENGEEINLDQKVERAADDTQLTGISNEFKNLQILGVQKKKDTTKRSIRFITVVNNKVIQDADDYGYIAVGAANMDTARSIVESYTLDKAPSKNVFSCKDKDNKISGDYGKKAADKDYKYVTYSVNDIKEYAVGVMFYVKDKNGNVFYAPYTNSGGTTYNSCVTDWNALVG